MSHVNSPKNWRSTLIKISPETEPLDEPSITAAMFGFLEAALQQHQITQWVRPGRILLPGARFSAKSRGHGKALKYGHLTSQNRVALDSEVSFAILLEKSRTQMYPFPFQRSLEFQS